MLYNKSDITTTTIDSPFGAGKQYYKAKQFPIIPPAENDLYVVTVEGDRLDLLAYTYYQDASLWWVISAINNNITLGSLFPVPGTQLRIPTNINNVLNIFNTYNT
jgi:hypothetical protein